MTLKISTLIALIFTLTFFTALSQPNKKKTAVEISGTVVSSATGLPVANAYVFIVEGEEEVLTNSKGEFKLKTWQKAPYKLTVQHQSFEKQVVNINAVSGALRIVLKKK